MIPITQVLALINSTFIGAGAPVAPAVVSATILESDPDALVVVFDAAVLAPDAAGLSITGTGAPSVSSVTSGSGTTTVTYALSAPSVGGESWTFVFSGANSVTAVSGGASLESGSAPVVGFFDESALEALTVTAGGFWLKGGAGRTIPSAPDVSPHTPHNTAVWGDFSQAVAAQRPHDSTVGTEDSVLYDGTGGFGAGDYMTSSLAASAWNMMHNTGFSFVLVLRINVGGGGTIFDNIGTNASGRGSYLQANNGTKNITWRVGDGSGTFAISEVLQAAYADGESLILDGGWTPEFGYYLSKNGGVAQTGVYGGTVPGTDASNTLYIGAGAPGSFGFGWFDLLDWYMQPGLPTAVERSNIINFLGAKHAITVASEWPAGYVESTEDIFLT